jgi:phospholipase C
VYQEYDNFGDNSLAYFPQFRNLNLDDPAHKERYQRARAYAGEGTQFDAKGLPLNTNTPDAQALVDAFAKDVQSGQLPAVSWIVAPTKFCEHPEKNPAGFGESLTSRIIDVLTADPAVWAQTALIICYDEEGGFFDHVPPPTAPSGRHDGYSTAPVNGEISGGESIGLGIRVPLLVVSPWSRGGWVCSEVFDHTSVIRFLEKRFGVHEPNISAWRRAVCGDLTSAFDFSSNNQERPATLFEAPHQSHIDRANASCEGPKNAEVTRVDSLVKQELGPDGNTRPARALAYRFEVQGQYLAEDDCFNMQFQNTGKAGVAFTVYPNAHNGGPWYYTIESGKQFTESWKLNGFGAEKYALRVMGPNGFLRVFQGKSNQQVEVKLMRNGYASNLQIELHNRANSILRLLISDMFYGAPDQSIELAPNSQFTLNWETQASFGWYDIRISIANDKDYLRRFAGHLETGEASRSDPANGKLMYQAELKTGKN